MTASLFHKGVISTGPDGQPAEPTPIPDELKESFVDAFWNSLAWRDTTWLGHRVAKTPTDLLAYQEIVQRLRPDWIIETGTANGGRALFFASVCELLDHGQVVSIDPHVADQRAEHPRITYVEGQAQDPATFAHVRELVGDSPHALVVLGSQPGTNLRIEDEFRVYAPLLPVGSYVIVENTIVNGHPVWPGFGPGPLEAVKRILAGNGDFVSDTKMEKFGLTFNPEGFLKRIR